jgi:adenosylhomocysteine nucleosidase
MPDRKYIALIAALPWEVRPLLRRSSSSAPVGRFGTSQHERSAVRELTLDGSPVLLTVGGAGNDNSYLSAQSLIRSFPLSGLISIGFAGGLVPGIEPGTVLRAEKVIEVATKHDYPCNTEFVHAHHSSCGALVSTNVVVRSSAEKRALGSNWGAIAVDMESAGVARAAMEAGLPFGALKSISDSVEHSLSIDFDRCRREDKDFSLWAVVRQGLTTLDGCGDLFRLAWNSRRAASALATALH